MIDKRRDDDTQLFVQNLAYIEHTNADFKCNKILKLSDQHKLQVSTYIFQLSHSNINEEIESSLLINNQIHNHNTNTNYQMSILCMNRSKTKHCVLHNDMITWNSLPDVFKVNVSFSMFKSKVRKYYLEKYQKILGRHYDCIFFLTCLQMWFFKCNWFWFWVLCCEIYNYFLCGYNQDNQECIVSWMCSW